MTFQEFQATARPVDDLSTVTQDDDVSGQPGIVYGETGLHVYTHTPAWDAHPAGPYKYMLIIGNQCWTDNNLEVLERKLYAFAVAEEYFKD